MISSTSSCGRLVIGTEGGVAIICRFLKGSSLILVLLRLYKQVTSIGK